MKTTITCCIAVAGLLAFSTYACDSPSVVAVPDGARTTTDELLEVQTRVQAYMAAMEEYLACLDQQIEDARGPEDSPPENMQLLINRYNAAVDEMEAVAASFNEQVRAHRAANSGD